MPDHIISKFPKSRIATIDVYAAGKQKHHISALLECDVTESRIKIRKLKSEGNKISFTAWLLKVIAETLKVHSDAAAFLAGRKKIVVFNNINISVLVEKNIGGKKVPIPLVIEKTNEKSIAEITREINDARSEVLNEGSVLLNREPSALERLYYYLPGTMRRSAWRFMLRYPRFIYRKMGNAAVTSVGMFGKLNGWFIHTSIHPVSFGIGSVVKKPVVVDNEIRIREILNMTILIDHDVIDGAPMVRFVSELVKNIENGYAL
jgi:pyruvate/2-oxoglutarate dehydrogenase complex dihydrolipoamide acyltransferase (E2) component